MFTDPRSVVSRSVRPSLVLKTPVRTTEARCEPGSAGWVCSMAAGSLASAAKTGGAILAAEKTSAKTWNSGTKRAMEKSLGWKRLFIVERNSSPSDRLLYFTRANLPQSGGAAQPHIAAGIPALQLFEHANHAFHGLVVFRTASLHRLRGVGRFGRHLFRIAMLQRSNKHIDGFNAHARIGVMIQRIEQGLPDVNIRCRTAKRLQGLHAHRGILILAGRDDQSLEYLLIPRRRLQGFEAIEADARVEALAIYNHIGEYAAHIAVLDATGENQRLFGTELNLHIGRARTRGR